MNLFQVMLSEKLLRRNAVQKPRYSSFLTPLFLIVIASFSTGSFANTVSGELNFLDATGAVTTTYQGGDSVVLQVVDGDRNGDPSTADSITVLLTSTTEDTGTPASASEPVAGDNTGDGTLSVVANGFETKTEDWTVTATYADEMTATFQVEGSVSGAQRDLTLDMTVGDTSVEYTTDGGEVTLTLTQGSTRFFSVLDGFTFSTTAAEIEGETITLDETGADTGVFTKTVVLNETDVSVLGNGELEAVPGDRITAFYEDPQGDYGDPEFAREVALYTRTVVPGGVIGTTIWDLASSPYLVTGDLTVSSGASLIIEAGVEVLFLANSDDQSGGQRLSDAELIVKGALVVEGTEAAPVVLGSSEANARAGDWGGIRVEGGSLSLTYAHLSHSGYGIYLQSVSSAGISFVDSVLMSSGGGVQAECCSSANAPIVFERSVIDVGSENWAVFLYGYNRNAPRMLFEGNTIVNRNGPGVYIEGVYMGLSFGSNVVNTASTGLQLYQPGGAVDLIGNEFLALSGNDGIRINGVEEEGGPSSSKTDLNIAGNVFEGNWSTAVRVRADDRAIVSSVSNNVVTGSWRGIELVGLQGVVVQSNTLTSNGYGVLLYDSVPSVFSGNTIVGNSERGLWVEHNNAELSEAFLVDGNDLSGNGTAIELHNYANVVVTGNDLSGSSQYGIANYTSNEIDARNNYWGESETDEMALGGNPKGLGFIYDGRDDGSYGTVNYAGWLEISPLSDDDKDGIDNDLDNCPLVANSDQSDLDGDGVGDVCDTDADNDGVQDDVDAYPLIPLDGRQDTDGDGAPDTCNAACLATGMQADDDDDGDGVSDQLDPFPLDGSESIDTDGDNIGNNADTDDDGDGTLDVNDAFPLDSTESIDTDLDGIGNNADTDDDGDTYSDDFDAFPLDPNEWLDTDGDNIGNNADLDDDGDGVLDINDGFPEDSRYSSDSDGDGLPDEWEVDYGLDPQDARDAYLDPDQDGYLNWEEFLMGTDPLVSEGLAQVLFTEKPANVSADRLARLTMQYTTTDLNPNLTGLGVRVHYDSSFVDAVTLENVFSTALIGVNDPQEDTFDFDGDPATDQYLLVSWASFSGASWPGEIPIALFDVVIDGNEAIETLTEYPIRFSVSDTSDGYNLSAESVYNPVVSATLDVDGDGQAKALTDGLLIIRRLFGFSGTSLTVGAVSSNATLTEPADIADRIDAFTAGFDADASGDTKALTDGLLIIRRLFGFSGTSLTVGAVSSDAERQDPDEIAAYIDGLMP